MRRPLLCLVFVLVALPSAGCNADPPSAPAKAAEPPVPAMSYDPASCGTITGLVTWVGPIPTVGPVLHRFPRADGSGVDVRTVPLANSPKIDRLTRGLEGAVIYLREVNPTTAKPWDLPPVAVEIRDDQIMVKQRRSARSGFVRRGDVVELCSREPQLQVLRGRGAAFFSLAFPDADQPMSRTFDACGRIELTSASGGYWQAAHLFVCDHPYYTMSDTDGRYTFTNVPHGRYELVAWHPNWNVVQTERHPEWGLPNRLIYGPPMESSRPVVVTRGYTTLCNLTFPK